MLVQAARRARLSRHDRGLDGVEVAYLSASEIAQQLAQGAVHLGVTGEDLVRELIADADRRVVFIDQLGFGQANVVVAVPQAWIDVRTMADLDDVATSFRARNGRKLRVATKYVNLTRGFFAAHGIIDYRIVEPRRDRRRAGRRHRRADRRHHHDRRDACRQRAEGRRGRRDPALAGKPRRRAHAAWDDAARESARIILDRIAAARRARAYREVRTRFAGCNDALLAEAHNRFGVVSPFGGPTSSGMLTLHCPPDQVHALASFLREHGAEAVSVASLEYVFARENALFAKLAAGLTN